MASNRPAPEPPLEYDEAGNLIMEGSIENWRRLASLMMSQDSLEEILASADRERRERESEESRQRAPLQTQEEAVKELQQKLDVLLTYCAKATWALLFTAQGLDCLGAHDLADATLMLLAFTLLVFILFLLVKMWIHVFK